MARAFMVRTFETERNSLKQGEYEKIADRELPFGPRTARMLVVILKMHEFGTMVPFCRRRGERFTISLG
jgi:hypothetical protein